MSASINQMKKGTLPCDTMANLKSEEGNVSHCVAIATQSGRVFDDYVMIDE